MEESFSGTLVKFVYNGEAFLTSLNSDSTFDEIRNTVRNRIKSVEDSILSMTYCIPPNEDYVLLESNHDWVMMMVYLKMFNSTYVEIQINVNVHHNNLLIAGPLTAENHDDMEDDDGMGNVADIAFGCFRQEDPKKYMTKSWFTALQDKGQYFVGGVQEFRNKLRIYSIENGFGYILEKNEPTRVNAYCIKRDDDNCEWKVQARLCRATGRFYITKFQKEHTCKEMIRVNKSDMMRASVVCTIVKDKLRANLNKGAKVLQSEIKESYGLDVPYQMIWYGKEKAMAQIHGNEVESYTKLLWFADKFVKENPDSRVVVDRDPETHKFQRLFVSFGACMKGFQFCRPMIFVDAGFLKNRYKGTIIGASGKDANQGLYPLAFAIVDCENDSNWKWFLERLREEIDKHCINLETNTRRKLTFLSDRHTAIMSSLPDVFPNDAYGFCFRHLLANIKGLYTGAFMKSRICDIFMRCAYARSEAQYEFNLAKLKAEGGDETITNFLKDLPKEKWYAAFFEGDRYGEMTNNISECFNSWIVDLRTLPVYYLADEIRRKLMEKIAARNELAKTWHTVMGPRMEKKLRDMLNIGRHWRVMPANGYLYEVQCDKYSTIVDMDSRCCSCRQWQLLRFPCSHALLVIQRLNQSPYDHLDNFYRVTSFRAAYSFPLNPIPSIERPLQDMSVYSPELLPPLTKKPAGRPRTKRLKSKAEKEIIPTKCSRCHKYAGHNKRTCTSVI